jgi:MYXO-CTERM domain-containing protein
MRGISDNACVGCHQGSNRTVLQYWGIRLDQNQDVTNGNQYPANLNANQFTNAADNPKLFDSTVQNATFNGRAAAQLLEYEDYDNDQRDDTPPDVHFEAGLGCIDCHGEQDLHGGVPGDPNAGGIASRKSQASSITCENCHGGISSYAETTACQNYAGDAADCALDNRGNVMRHVTKAGDGTMWLRSRVDGALHYLPQTRDTVVNSNKLHPLTGQQLYSPKASYAMGRSDGNQATGLGPMQANPQLNNGFSHTDDMDCASCHSAWTNNCIGCHLKGQYDDDPNNFFFSNITGERINIFQANADFVYQNPISFTLGVNSKGKIAEMTPGSGWFYRYEDLNGNESDVFAFSDRNGNGNNPNVNGRGAFGALSHNQMMAHSIRGKVTVNKEGPRYCVNCHLTDEALNNFGDEYTAFRDAIANNDFANLDYNLLQEHFGQNTGNQLNSPLWISMVVGLGTGLYLFDDTGCPENPLDANANRQYCPDGAPADTFDPNTVVYNLDRLVEDTGVSNASNGHPMLDGLPSPLRDGANNPYLAGPLGRTLINRLSNPDPQQGGIVLDSWLDANSGPQGQAAVYLNQAIAAGPVPSDEDKPTSSGKLVDPNVTGGCSTGGGSSNALLILWLALGLGALFRWRRQRS